MFSHNHARSSSQHDSMQPESCTDSGIVQASQREEMPECSCLRRSRQALDASELAHPASITTHPQCKRTRLHGQRQARKPHGTRHTCRASDRTRGLWKAMQISRRLWRGPVNVQTSLAGTRQWALWGRGGNGKRGERRPLGPFFPKNVKNPYRRDIPGGYGDSKSQRRASETLVFDRRRDFCVFNILTTQNRTDSGGTPEKCVFFPMISAPWPAPCVTFLFF